MRRSSSSKTERSRSSRLWYWVLYHVCRMSAILFFRVRCEGRQYEPLEGGVLVISNHQSNFDPVIIGLACRRRMNYVARDTLFGFAPFRWLCHSLDAIDLDTDGSGLSGLKETLRRLKRGEMVLIFPEGSRTPHGEIDPFKAGFCTLARRGNVRILPAAMEGAFHSWPATQWLPWPTTVHIHLGPPIEADQIAAMTDEELVAESERRVRSCHQAARQGRRRALRLA